MTSEPSPDRGAGVRRTMKKGANKQRRSVQKITNIKGLKVTLDVCELTFTPERIGNQGRVLNN